MSSELDVCVSVSTILHSVLLQSSLPRLLFVHKTFVILTSQPPPLLIHIHIIIYFQIHIHLQDVTFKGTIQQGSILTMLGILIEIVETDEKISKLHLHFILYILLRQQDSTIYHMPLSFCTAGITNYSLFYRNV